MMEIIEGENRQVTIDTGAGRRKTLKDRKDKKVRKDTKERTLGGKEVGR